MSKPFAIVTGPRQASDSNWPRSARRRGSICWWSPIDHLMPGATETDFFERADMLDTQVGQSKKDDPADVARVGFDAMMRGDGDVVSGWKNKLQSAIANVTPAGVLAEQHRRMAEPGSAKKAES
jgi:hypothetical protein